MGTDSERVGSPSHVYRVGISREGLWVGSVRGWSRTKWKKGRKQSWIVKE